MADDVFTMDFDQTNLKQLISLLDDLSKKDVDETTKKAVSAAGEVLLEEEKRIIKAHSDKNYRHFSEWLKIVEIRKRGKSWIVKAGYDANTIREHLEVLIAEFGRPGKHSKKIDKKGRRIGAVQAYPHIRAAFINKSEEAYAVAAEVFMDAIEERWNS